MENFNFKWRERTEKDYVLPEDANLLAEGIKETQKAFENYTTPPTKMSELEQDLPQLLIGETYISSGNISNNSYGGTMRYGGFHTKLEGSTVTIKGTSSTTIKNVVTPTADTDAANKKYVDDITGDISTALDSILAMQSQYMGVSE